MKEWIKKHKMSIFVIVAAVIMLIGLSYAWLQITLRGEKDLTLTSGTLRLVLDDSMTDGINLNNAVPVTDEEGKTSSSYTFTLENTGTIDSDYEISLEDLSLAENQERMQDQFIKYQLTKDGEEVFLGILNDRVLDRGKITKTSKHTYTLKMWIDENATTEVMGTAFKGILKVEAMQTAKIQEITQ